MLTTQFKKSSCSTWYPHNQCVEVACRDNTVVVRDSKNPTGTQLHFTKEEWDAFVQGAKKGEFDISK